METLLLIPLVVLVLLAAAAGPAIARHAVRSRPTPHA